MADPSFFQFLGNALTALRLEAPVAYAALQHALAPTGLQLTVDGGTRYLTVLDESHRLAESGESPVVLATHRATLVALLEARCTLVDAVFDDRIEIQGTPEHVVALHDALVAFFAGAVRSRSFPALLEDYLGPGPNPTPARSTAKASISGER